MDRDDLFAIVNVILNHATDADIEVIIKALKRRAKGHGAGTFRGINPERLAKESAGMINKQMNYSIGSLRKMIQNFAVDLIKKEAPELNEAQISELMDAWIPDNGKRQKEAHADLPADVLLTMIRQFLAYSSGTMSPSEQMELESQIPDWQRTYWERMPGGIRSVLTLFLKGTIDSDECWDQIYADLDLQRLDGEN